MNEGQTACPCSHPTEPSLWGQSRIELTPVHMAFHTESLGALLSLTMDAGIQRRMALIVAELAALEQEMAVEFCRSAP